MVPEEQASPPQPNEDAMAFDIEDLRELAEAAFGAGEWVSVGTWVESDNADEPDVCSCDPNAMGQPKFEKTHRNLQLARSAYIASIQPRVLLEVLSTLSALQGERQ